MYTRDSISKTSQSFIVNLFFNSVCTKQVCVPTQERGDEGSTIGLFNFDKTIKVTYNKRVNDMSLYLLIHKNMVKNVLVATTVALGLSTNPASADTNKEAPSKIEQKINQQKVQQKLDTVVCKTKKACELLSSSIQSQIDELETKGIENLTDDEFNKYAKLSDDLIAVEKAETKQEKAETANNDELIAQEKAETANNNDLIAEENEKQSRLTQVEKRLDSIEGSL